MCSTALQGPWVVVPATPKAANALSALVRAARLKRQMALVRYALMSNSTISLGVMVPVEGTVATDLDHFLLYRVPWGDEYQNLNLPEHDDLAVSTSPPTPFTLLLSPVLSCVQAESWLRSSAAAVCALQSVTLTWCAQEKVNISDDEHLEPVDAFVEAMAQPEGSRLPCDLVMDPARSCATLAMVRSGIDGPQEAGEGLDGDPLVQKILVPQGWVKGDSHRLGEAVRKLSRKFPAAALAGATSTVVGAASARPLTNEEVTTKIEPEQKAVAL